MNKAEFLKELESRLQMLEEQERKDMLSEYSQHIDMKMKAGMEEKDAIKDFGDIDNLISEILEAYHIDPNYKMNGKRAVSGDITKKKGNVLEASKNSLSGFLEQKRNKKEEKASRRQEQRPFNKDLEKTRLSFFERKKWDIQKGEESFDRKLWRWLKTILVICLKAALVVIMVPAIIADLFLIYGFGLVITLLLQGYPLVGVCIGILGVILCCSAYSLFVLTYILKSYKNKKRKEVAV